MALATPDGGGDADLELVAELPAPSKDERVADDLVISGDVLQVDVFQMDKLSRSVQVDSSGKITLPLVGSIAAANRSVSQLERDVAAKFSYYLQAPNVVISMKESQARRATVDGQIKLPGRYPITANSTLSEIIAQAGGFNDIADQSKVYVYRRVGPKQYVANYDLAQVRAAQRRDPRIYGRDTVVVFSSSGRVAWTNVKDALGVASSASRIVPIN